jgi:hypothetical protein
VRRHELVRADTAQPDDTSDLDSVSCPDTSVCVAVGSASGTPLIERYSN